MLDGGNIFERRPKLTARTSFPCGQLDENGCLQGKGARTESSTGCMLKVSFCGLCYVPVFRRKLRQTKKIISLTYDNQQINRRAARYVVFIRENSRIPPFISTQEVSSIEPAARIKSFFMENLSAAGISHPLSASTAFSPFRCNRAQVTFPPAILSPSVRQAARAPPAAAPFSKLRPLCVCCTHILQKYNSASFLQSIFVTFAKGNPAAGKKGSIHTPFAAACRACVRSPIFLIYAHEHSDFGSAAGFRREPAWF